MDCSASKSIFFHRSRQSDVTRVPTARSIASGGSSWARGMSVSHHGSHKPVSSTPDIELAHPVSALHSG